MEQNNIPADVQGKALTYSLKGSWINYPHPHQGKIFYPGTGQSEVYSRYLDGYIAGATAENDRAQKLADDLQLMLDQFELNPELAWLEIAQNMKRIGKRALEQWKGAVKEVEKSKGLHSGNKHQWQDDWDMDEQGELNEETD